MIDLKKHLVNTSDNIKEALRRLDEIADFEILNLFVLDNEGTMVGSLTDGDIRRGFLRGLDLSYRVQDFMNTPFQYLKDNGTDPVKIKEINCHVRDFARLIELVLNSDNAIVNYEVFNAGGDVNSCTKKMIVETILEYIPDGIVEYKDKGSDPRNYRVSFEKVKKVLGFMPEYTVRDGIMELIDGLKVGIYADSLDDKNRYGNYEITYTS